MEIKDKYFTISEAAKFLQVTRQTVSRYIKQGWIHAEKIGRERVIAKQELYDKLNAPDVMRRGVRLLDRVIDAKLIQYVRNKYGYAPNDEIQIINDKFVITRSNGTQERVDYPELEIVIQGFDEDNKRAVVVIKPLNKTKRSNKSK